MQFSEPFSGRFYLPNFVFGQNCGSKRTLTVQRHVSWVKTARKHTQELTGSSQSRRMTQRLDNLWKILIYLVFWTFCWNNRRKNRTFGYFRFECGTNDNFFPDNRWPKGYGAPDLGRSEQIICCHHFLEITNISFISLPHQAGWVLTELGECGLNTCRNVQISMIRSARINIEPRRFVYTN